MDVPLNFEPYIDYERITPEMTEDLHAALREHQEAAKDFLENDEADLVRAARVVEAAHSINATYEAILQILWTKPVMVHVAGPKKHETDPADEDSEGVVQRCSRCGSVLGFWHEGVMFFDPNDGPRPLEEEDLPWWDEGTIVAKSDNGTGAALYMIEKDRPLEKHEVECADLSGLES